MKSSNMKNMQDLVGNFDVTKHEEKEIVVDQFAKSVINKVFDELALILPGWKYAWKSDDPQNPDKVLNAAKQQWTKAFIENNICTVEQISFGFAKARKHESDFVPSCGKFISWCSPSPEDLGYPSEQRALMMCVTHRNKLKMNMPVNTRQIIVELCKHVDWFLMNAASNQAEHKKAEAHFKAEYMSLINSGYQEPVETNDKRLETREVVIDRMSPDQLESRKNRGLNCMSEVRRQLAKAKLKNIGE